MLTNIKTHKKNSVFHSIFFGRSVMFLAQVVGSTGAVAGTRGKSRVQGVRGFPLSQK